MNFSYELNVPEFNICSTVLSFNNNLYLINNVPTIGSLLSFVMYVSSRLYIFSNSGKFANVNMNLSLPHGTILIRPFNGPNFQQK